MLPKTTTACLSLWSDQELIREGGIEARAELWCRWLPWLRSAARRYHGAAFGGVEQFVEAVLDETWDEFSRAHMRADSVPRCKALLARIIQFNALDERRRARIEENESEESPSAAPSPYEEAVRTRQRQDVDRALAGLPHRFARVLRLKYWEGMTSREIATIERTSTVNADQLVHRARRLLAPVLEKWKGHFQLND